MKKRLIRFIKKGKLYEVLYIVTVCLILNLFVRVEVTFFVAILGLFLILKFNPFLPALFVLVLAVAWPILVLVEKEAWAEKTGFFAYYLLAISVVLYIVQEIKRPKRKKPDRKPKKRGRPRKTTNKS